MNVHVPNTQTKAQKKTPAELMTGRLDMLELMTEAPPRPDLVMPNLATGVVGILSAPGATAKTWWILQMLCGLTARSVEGSDTLSLFGPSGVLSEYPERTAIYLCAEDGRDVMWRRLAAIREALPQEAVDAIVKRLHLVPLAGKGVNLNDDAWTDAIIAEVRKIGATMIVGETVSRMHIGDENDNGHMARFVSSLEKIAVETSAAVLVSTHQGKGAVLAGQGDLAQATRGASALTDNARWVGNLRRMTPDEAKAVGIDNDLRKRLIRWGLSKSNHGLMPPDVWYFQTDTGVLIPYPMPEPKSAPAGSSRSSTKKRKAAEAEVNDAAAGDLVVTEVDHGPSV